MTIFAASTLFDRLSRWVPRSPLALCVATAVASGVLSACGGGTQAEKFVPSKIVSFGDESSALVTVEVASAASAPQYIHGQKYGVNYVTWTAVPNDSRLPASGAASVSVANAASNAAAWGPYGPASVPASSISSSTVSSLSGLPDIVGRTFQAVLSIFYTDPTATPTTQQLSNGTVDFAYSHDCYVANKLWIQIVAAGFGKGYNPGTAASEPKAGCPADLLTGAVTYAQPHALVSSSPVGMTVKSVRDQVTEHIGDLDRNTLVTMLAGQNDVVAKYKSALAGAAAAPTPASAAQIIATAKSDMKAKGQELGQIINEITRTGARVAYAILPDLSRAPLITAGTGQDGAFLQALVEAFNSGLTGSNGAVDDGHKVAAGVQIPSEFNPRFDNPSLYSVTNAAWCDSTKARRPDGTLVSASDPDVVLFCSSLTGVASTADQSTYLWADDTHLGPAGHAIIGSVVYNQITANPL